MEAGRLGQKVTVAVTAGGGLEQPGALPVADAGILRVSGIAYQFRHQQLQARLTTTADVGADIAAGCSGDAHPRKEDPVGVKWVHEGRGCATRPRRCASVGARDAETPLIPLDETILIMKTVDTMLVQARGDA